LRRVVRFAVLRLAALRGLAAAVVRFTVERFGAALLRVAAAPLDFARDAVLRAVVLRAVEAAGASSDVHLPDITRCAASATASAMIDPSLVALDTMLLAACDAVSAASSPASRILRRAAGLALIAAAAAARPAASISLLIAAFANLLTVLLPDFEEDDRLEVDPGDDLEELFLGDFAIAFSPRSGEQTL